MGYFLELLSLSPRLGASLRVLALLCDLSVASCEWCSNPPEDWFETLGALARVPGIHQEDTPAGAVASPGGPFSGKDLVSFFAPSSVLGPSSDARSS